MRLLAVIALTLSFGLCPVRAQEKAPPKEPAKPPKKVEEFYPLAIGSTWKYQTKVFDEDGETTETKTDVSTVKGVYDLKEGRFYCVEEFGWSFWSRNTPAGVVDTDIEIDEETQQFKTTRKPSLFYKYPVKPGDKYDIDLNDGEDPFNRMEIEAVAQEISVPAGKFKCIVYALYEIEGNFLFNRTYFAPGVGPVKYETFEDGQLADVSVLETYELKGK